MAALEHMRSSHAQFYDTVHNSSKEITRRLGNKKIGEQVSLPPLLPGLCYKLDPIDAATSANVTKVLGLTNEPYFNIAGDIHRIPKTGQRLPARCEVERATTRSLLG